MDRTTCIRELAAVARRSHAATLAGLGWLALDLPTEQLEELLVVMSETARAWTPDSHLTAYEERWGRQPDATR